VVQCLGNYAKKKVRGQMEKSGPKLEERTLEGVPTMTREGIVEEERSQPTMTRIQRFLPSSEGWRVAGEGCKANR